MGSITDLAKAAAENGRPEAAAKLLQIEQDVGWIARAIEEDYPEIDAETRSIVAVTVAAGLPLEKVK